MNVTPETKGAPQSPGPPSPGPQKGVSRDRLLAAATHLFARTGLYGVTTHDIAHAAGLAAGTFYLHFRDKNAIFREIALHALEELKGRLQRVGEATEGDPERAVRVQAEELLRFAEENRNLVQILFGRDQEAAQIGAHVLRQLALQSEKAWRSRIEAGTARKELDPEVVAQGVLGMLARVVAWWAENPGRVPREDVLWTLTQLQLYGAYGRSRPGAGRDG